MFYNADLLDIPGDRSGRLSLGFIDDIAYGIQGQSAEENARELETMLKKGERWRKMNGAKFETDKYTLVHFTRARRNPTAGIHIGNITIKPTNEAKYLGVLFDRKLSFQHHIQHAAKKGTKFALAISRIAKCTRGPAYQQTRTLFTSVAAPRMDYAAVVWYRPPNDVSPPCPTSLAKLEAAQHTAMKAILGTFRTTPSSALQIETSLPPGPQPTFASEIESYNHGPECRPPRRLTPSTLPPNEQPCQGAMSSSPTWSTSQGHFQNMHRQSKR